MSSERQSTPSVYHLRRDGTAAGAAVGVAVGVAGADDADDADGVDGVTDVCVGAVTVVADMATTPIFKCAFVRLRTFGYEMTVRA
jgi:hypothetical protein